MASLSKETHVHQLPVQLSDESAPRPETHIRGVIRDILVAFALVSIPMIAFSALLLGLVFKYRVTPHGPEAQTLSSVAYEHDQNALYVDLSATVLTTVASWSSTVAPLVVPFILSLVSFPVARTMIQASQSGDKARQPTPYQLVLILRIICNSSLTSLWYCVTYFCNGRTKRAPTTRSLSIMTGILSIASFLSLLVFATDTWLHVATKTVNLTQFQAANFENASFVLRSDCTDVNTTFKGGCTLNPAAANTFLMNSEPALELLSNVSEAGMVQGLVDSTGNKYAFLGLPVNERSAKMDYKATTFGVHTQCRPITDQCINGEADASGPSTRYHCSSASMDGSISTNEVDAMVQTYFTDSSLSNNNTVLASLPNPYYFGTVVSVNQNLGRGSNLNNEPDIANGLHGSTIVVFLCNSTVFDWTYSSVNASVTYSLGTRSNASTTNIMMGTNAYTNVGDSYLLRRTSLDVWQSRTAQEMADKFAYAYSQTVLAAFGSALQTAAAVEAQSWSSTLVAKVPKAPLSCLLVVNLMLVLLGVFLTVVAFLALNDDSRDVQARLSINSLVAAHFEPSKGEAPVERIDDSFQELNGMEGPRVGVARTESGGWKLFGH